MKTYKNLYPQIYSFENLHTAYRRARAGPRGRRTLMTEPGTIAIGVDRPPVSPPGENWMVITTRS